MTVAGYEKFRNRYGDVRASTNTKGHVTRPGEQSDHQFATGHSLRRDAMMWFWDQYTTDPRLRSEITASPLLITITSLQYR